MPNVHRVRITFKNQDLLETKINELKSLEKRLNELFQEIDSFKPDLEAILIEEFESDESGYNPNK